MGKIYSYFTNDRELVVKGEIDSPNWLRKFLFSVKITLRTDNIENNIIVGDILQ